MYFFWYNYIFFYCGNTFRLVGDVKKEVAGHLFSRNKGCLWLECNVIESHKLCICTWFCMQVLFFVKHFAISNPDKLYINKLLLLLLLNCRLSVGYGTIRKITLISKAKLWLSLVAFFKLKVSVKVKLFKWSNIIFHRLYLTETHPRSSSSFGSGAAR